MEGNNRVFQWGDIVEQVCTDEHVKSEFRAALLDAKLSPDIMARGRVSWEFLYENNFPLKLKDSDLIGKGETGLTAFRILMAGSFQRLRFYFPQKEVTQPILPISKSI